MAEQKANPAALVPVPFPMKGVSENQAHFSQPVNTTSQALNVRVFDPVEDRMRGGQREGVSKYITDAVNGTNRIQHLKQYTRVVPLGGIISTTTLRSDAFDGAEGVKLQVAQQSEWTERRKEDTSGVEELGWFEESAIDAQATANFVSGRLGFDLSGENLNSDGYAKGVLSLPSEGFDSTEKFIVRVLIRHFLGGSVFLFPAQQTNAKVRGGIAFRLRTGTNTNDYMMAALEIVTPAVTPGTETDFKIVLSKFVDSSGSGTYTQLAESDNLGPLENPDVPIAGPRTDHVLEVHHNKNVIEIFYDGQSVITRDVTNDGLNSTVHDGVGLGFNMQESGTFTSAHFDEDNLIQFNDFSISSAAEPGAFGREVKLLAVSGGSIFSGDRELGLFAAGGLSSGILNSESSIIESVLAFQRIYLIDGKQGGGTPFTSYIQFDLLNNEVNAWAARGPGPELSNVTNLPARCRLIALFKGRIVLANQEGSPHIWFMSGIGAPDGNEADAGIGTGGFGGINNWNFDSAEPSSAVAGTNAEFGDIGDPITALIPFRDDQLIFGADQSIWVLTGDPHPSAVGETAKIAPTLQSLSQDIGVVGARAWAEGPDRSVFIMSTNGLYQLKPNQFNISETTRISAGVLDKTFRELNIRTHIVQLKWHRQRFGLSIYVTPVDEATTTHYFFDMRTGGFTTSELPSTVGPTAVEYFNADIPINRAMLLGGFDSFIRFEDDAAKSDDDTAGLTAISSKVLMGPIRNPWPGYEMKITALQAAMDETSDDVAFQVLSGDTAEIAKTATSSFSGTFSAGRSVWVHGRSRGSALYVELSSSALGEAWQLESLNARVSRAGRIRKR